MDSSKSLLCAQPGYLDFPCLVCRVGVGMMDLEEVISKQCEWQASIPASLSEQMIPEYVPLLQLQVNVVRLMLCSFGEERWG